MHFDNAFQLELNVGMKKIFFNAYVLFTNERL